MLNVLNLAYNDVQLQLYAKWNEALQVKIPFPKMMMQDWRVENNRSTCTSISLLSKRTKTLLAVEDLSTICNPAVQHSRKILIC